VPPAAAIARSSGVVKKPRTSSGLAPTYVVCTVTDAFSLRGYSRTFNERTACKPAMMITRLTTIANTGRRMNKSVNFMAGSLTSRVSWIGLPRRVRLEVVVDHDVSAVTQLEAASRHDDVVGVQPVGHHHEVALRR